MYSTHNKISFVVTYGFTRTLKNKIYKYMTSLVTLAVISDLVISDLSGEEIVGIFYEKKFQKTNQTEFRVDEIIKRKGNKLYVKWKGYDYSFDIWIDKKDII